MIAWIKGNLFDTPSNTLITIICLAILAWIAPPLCQWLFWDADWFGAAASACEGTGACWVFVKVRMGQFLYGFYPESERWRVNSVVIAMVVHLVWLAWPNVRGKKWLGLSAIIILPILGACFLLGGLAGLASVPTHQWGGLMVTLVIAYMGIITAMPLGVLLALGRQSDLPIIKAFCTLYIELWRAVPLITVLFMASLMLPLFLPDGAFDLDKLVRAMIGVTLFQAAYLAEVVRGGLQAIPKGQLEAAKSLGMGYWQTQWFIVLPQALRLMIPGIVNTFIALFKDTSLVMIIGIYDLLGMAKHVISDPAWPDVSAESFVFVGLVFWCFCFLMSRYSKHLEMNVQ